MQARLLTVTALLFAPALCFGQQLALNTLPSAPEPTTSVAPLVVANQKTAPASHAWEGKFDRWVDLREMDFSLRYRSVFDSNNAHEYNQGQQRSIVDGKFKFDEQGKYGVVFHASTGKYFNWAYADFMGGGNAEAFATQYIKADTIQQAAMTAFLTPTRIAQQGAAGGWSFYIRRLYLELEPRNGIVLQYGSLDIDRGAASEITTYDYDGYIDGGRVSIFRPKNLFFDEASVTYAYIGDLYTPNFFARGERLEHSNYHQFLVRKKIAHRINASLDYTWQNASNTWREAAEFNVPEARVVDFVRFEAYERTNQISYSEIVDFVPGAKGYAVTAAKKNIAKRVSLEGGYAHVDPHQGVLTQSESSGTLCMGVNGDSYGLGNRYFVRPTVKLTPYLNLVGYYTHEIGTFSVVDQIVWNKQALNAGFVFDLKKALFKDKPAY